MEIATGYFAKVKTYADMGYALVSIARVAPWFVAKELKLYQCDELKPTDEILELRDNPTKYEERYRREVLNNVNHMSLYRKLYLIARQEFRDKVVLLCYESPEKFCHRHIVAEWLKEKFGIDVREVDLSKEVYPQISLFESDV